VYNLCSYRYGTCHSMYTICPGQASKKVSGVHSVVGGDSNLEGGCLDG